MIELWSDASEDFYDHFFTYLKAKFTNEAPVFSDEQKSTNVCIYHETIVALEQVHRILRAIENGSAYTREDFKKAVEKNDEQKTQLIINFYKQLALAENLKYRREFIAFSSNYYFDARIASYIIFLESVDTELLENFSAASLWNEKNFKPDSVFDFISAYKNWLDEGGGMPSLLQEEVDQQNNQARDLKKCVEDLIKSKAKIGVSQFDIKVPTSLKISSEKNDELNLSEFRHFMDLLHGNFRWDDGILLTVNHVHKISNFYYSVSLLIIYKQKKYQSASEVYERYKSYILDMVGIVRVSRIQVINRSAMIQKIYPNKRYIDNLNSDKQKNDFFNNFLKYFLSSIFVLKSIKVADERYKGTFFSYLLNDFKYYQEKIYVEKEKHRLSTVKLTLNRAEFSPYDDVRVLLNEPAFEKFDKYFAIADLPPQAIERLKILEFLYVEQGLHKTSNSFLIADIIKVERFMTRLMYNRQWKLIGSIDNRSDFEKKPKFSKLPILLKQLILIREMECFYNPRRYQNIHYSEAIFTLKRLEGKLSSKLDISEIGELESTLWSFTDKYLKPIIDREKSIASKAAKQAGTIQKYLYSIIEDDMVALRFIFNSRYIKNELEANVFRDMFTDFIENLKRRYTGGARLIGQVGIYIPSEIEHSVDVVLFFKAKENITLEYRDLQIAVKDYWENYVDNKYNQIQEFNKKRGKKYSGNKTNPFAILKDKSLAAESRDLFFNNNPLNQEVIFLYPNMKQTRKLIEELSRLYAYYPLLLSSSLVEQYSDRKHLVILGRKRTKQTTDRVKNI